MLVAERTRIGARRSALQPREWILTIAVIVVPLIIAIAVTLWSLEQARYRPKKQRPAREVARETNEGSEGPPTPR
jgi:hypothetical protein